jgi:hypothetical protein
MFHQPITGTQLSVKLSELIGAFSYALDITAG